MGPGSALVLNYYQPWTFAGSERFLQLMQEELALGRSQAYVYIADASARDEIERRSRLPEYARLFLYEYLGEDRVCSVSPAAVRYSGRGEISLPSLVDDLEPTYVRSHFPARGFLQALESPSFRKVPFLYDVMDHWKDFPSTPWGDNADEELYVKRATAVSAVSHFLVEQFSGERTVHLVPNAVDSRFLERLRSATIVRSDTRKQVLYMGGMGGSWFDWELVHELADELPDHLITLLGSTRPPPEEHLEVLQRHVDQCLREVAGFDNVRLVPEVPHDTLMPWLAQGDVGIIPFVPNELVEAVSPLKVYEYLGAGMPVVQIGMPDIEGYPGVRTARSRRDFVDLVRESNRTEVSETESKAMRDFCSDATWGARLAQIDDIIAKPE